MWNKGGAHDAPSSAVRLTIRYLYTLDLQVHHAQADLCVALRVNVAATC
jgi:hypothetical protein